MPGADRTEMLIALAGCTLGYRVSNRSVQRIVRTTPGEGYIVRGVLIVRCICVIDVFRICVWPTASTRRQKT